MSRADRRLRRHLDALLGDRRPRRGSAGDDAGAMRFAARLRAEHPGSAEPSAQFVDDLARRLRSAQGQSDEPAGRMQRRRFLAAGLATATASVAAGAGLERLREALTEPAAGGGSIQPYNGEWVAVATLAEVRPGRITSFSAGGIQGFVFTHNGEVKGLSAACTHQGCILSANPSAGTLVCPCHPMSFGLDGVAAPGAYRLNPLPAVQTRITGDSVEVLVPHWA